MATTSAEFNYTGEDIDRFMEVALRLTKDTESIIRLSHGKAKLLEDKADDDQTSGHASKILTETDKAVEDLLVKGLAIEFPNHKFIAEESTSLLDGKISSFTNEPTWIIDPIDGTMNFVHGNPLICTSIALAINRRVVLGIVSAPLIGHTYTAIRGKGAFLNGIEKLHVSQIKRLNKAMVLMELPAGSNETRRGIALENVAALLTQAHALRSPGPAALDSSWVGSGSADVFYAGSLHCWDYAAGALIVIEAGGCVLSPDGGEANLMGRGIIAAASMELAQEVAATLKRYPSVETEFDDHCPI